MNRLPKESEKLPIRYDYFPTCWQAVIWRNWGYIPAERIAAAIHTDVATVRREAERLGLNPQIRVNPEWMKRGYLTTIRENWHLCSYKQIMTLLDLTEEQLAFILKEDDFMWVKLGEMKPRVSECVYQPLDESQQESTRQISEKLKKYFPHEETDNAFDFIADCTSAVTHTDGETVRQDNLRMVYPYFALYGDALIDEGIDPLPEKILEEYQKAGINGIWMQMVLYQLVEFPFDPSLSKGWEKRIASLNKLVQKAKRYGIGIYPYLNEPRAMTEAFYERYPHLKGEREGEYFAMCTSEKEVQDYLYNGVRKLFETVPDLAGFFMITMSENLTNCYSRSHLPEHGTTGQISCKKCQKRKPWEVVAEVNNLMAKGAHDANPNAKVISWTWGWPDEWAEKVVPLLTEGQILQCTSEEAMDYCIGGIHGSVLDYTMSLCGPGEKAKKMWKAARECHLSMSAKVQINNTWEMSVIPFIPVFGKVEEHIENLKKEGITHLHAGWTLGGAPSPNLELAAWLMEGKGNLRDFLHDRFGKENGDLIWQAQALFSDAFSHYPFHMNTLYFGPQNFGPMAPFFMENTGYEATMIGFPYDDLEKWAAIYPQTIYEEEYRRLTRGWKQGLDLLAPAKGKDEKFDEVIRMAEAAYCQFESALHHILFVKYRNADQKAGRWEHREELLSVIAQEKEVVKTLADLRKCDSRIGYESSNQYFYTLQDLKEKMLNLCRCEELLTRECAV